MSSSGTYDPALNDQTLEHVFTQNINNFQNRVNKGHDDNNNNNNNDDAKSIDSLIHETNQDDHDHNDRGRDSDKHDHSHDYNYDIENETENGKHNNNNNISTHTDINVHTDTNTNNNNNDNNNDNDNNNNTNGNANNDIDNVMQEGNIDVTKITVDNRPIRIYLDGVFDMAHYGHYRLFKAVKDKFPNSTVIVGVSGDEETIRLKGQTLMDEKERAESVGHCKWVDEVVCPCPWIITQEFLDQYKIDYVAHDGLPYTSANNDDIYDFVKRQGKFIATQRTDGISTTDLINRIVKRYNEFVLRNLNRGVPRTDLNVSWTREKRIQLGAAVDKGKEKVFEVGKKGLEIVDNVQEWIKDPGLFIDSFLHTFGPHGHLANKVKEKAQQIKEEFVDYAINAPM